MIYSRLLKSFDKIRPQREDDNKIMCSNQQDHLFFTTIKRQKYGVAVFMLLCSYLIGSAQCISVNQSFQSGEKVMYNAYYNWHFIWLNAGEVTFEVQHKTYQNKKVLKLSSIGSTFKNYDFFYKVRDTFEAYVDTLSLLPYLANRRSNEGGSSVYETYRFDRDNKVIRAIIKNEESEDFIYPDIIWKDCTYDLISMVYAARNIDFGKYRTNDKIPIRMAVDGNIYDLYIRYLGKETITTRDDRTFRCLKFSPLLMEGTIFKSGEDMTVWVTDDMNHLPIIVEAKILIGSVKAILSTADGLRYPLLSEIIE